MAEIGSECRAARKQPPVRGRKSRGRRSVDERIMGGCTLQFNANSEQNLADPYPAYRLLRDTAPVYHSAELGFWAFSRYDDVRTAARAHDIFSSAGGVELEIPGWLYGPGSFINADPPWHDSLRKLVRERFAPRRVNELSERIRSTVAELLEPLFEARGGDIAVEFTRQLPLHVVSEILGVPKEDRRMLAGWHDSLYFDRRPGELEMTAAARDAVPLLADYFRCLARDRKREPRDDLMSDLMATGLAGPWGEVAEEIIRSLCFLLFSAGSETTHSLLGTSFLVLSSRPEECRRITADPSRLPALIEEVVRYDAPVQHLARTTVKRGQVGGKEIPEGQRVLLLFGSANRDERFWIDPDRFDPSREAKRHLGFGEGIHFCMGAPLARLEASVVLEVFFGRVVDYEVCGPVIRNRRGTNRGIDSLPIRW